MFYVSKVSPFFFLLALLNLVLSLAFKLIDSDLVLFTVALVFGFIGTTLIGAMYQIVPNSQNRKLPFAGLSYAVFVVVLVSFVLFYAGEHRVASGMLSLAYFAFLVHVLLSIQNWMPVTVKFLGASALYLFLASLFLFLSLAYGLVPFQLAVHSLTVGSMLSAVYGVELAWIPMLLMETLNVKRAKNLFWAKQVSTVIFLLAFYSLEYRLVALASLLELGVSLYFLYLIYSLIKNRRMPSPIPYVVKVFLVALGLLPFGILMGGFLASHPQLIGGALDLHVDLLVYGFTTFTIFGGMSHLLPRIVWNWKFASSKKDKVPAVNELVDEKGFPKFIEVSLIMFAVFLYLDLSFYPLDRLSPILYLFILGYFLRLTFLHLVNKLKEVGDGGDKET